MKSAIITTLAIISIAATGQQTTAGNRHDSQEPEISLYYSDGSPASFGIDAVNQQLATIGVRVSRVTIPDRAKPILLGSRHRALTDEEAADLIESFHLGRRELLEILTDAGRTPALHRGGYLEISEKNVAPYPKVYDMKALDPETVIFLQKKFGKLHVNSSESGAGIDEVMTIVAGGPYTWFFVLEENVVGKLRFGKVHMNGKAWRISYPGLVPHGGFFDADHGLVVAHAHGPRHFVMRYEDPSVEGFETLGDNPWINFSSPPPVLLKSAKPSEN